MRTAAVALALTLTLAGCSIYLEIDAHLEHAQEVHAVAHGGLHLAAGPQPL